MGRAFRVALCSVGCLLLLTACDAEPAFVTRCKRAVELRLASPSTARYGSLKDVAPNPSNSYMQSLDRHGYTGAGDIHVWLAYVDSENALGATTRNYIACVNDQDGFNLEVKPGIGALSRFIE